MYLNSFVCMGSPFQIGRSNPSHDFFSIYYFSHLEIGIESPQIKKINQTNKLGHYSFERHLHLLFQKSLSVTCLLSCSMVKYNR